MKGNNKLQLCLAEMKEAMEYYLNNKVLKEPVKVTKLYSRGNIASDGFVIEISEKEENGK